MPEAKRGDIAARQVDGRTDQKGVDAVGVLTQKAAAPAIGRGVCAGDESVVRAAQHPLAERIFTVLDRPVGGTRLQAREPRRRQGKLGLKGVQRAVVVIHHGVSGGVTTNDLIIVEAIRGQAGKDDFMIRGKARLISGAAKEGRFAVLHQRVRGF